MAAVAEVSDEHQTISNVKVAGDFAESAVYTDKTNGTPILYARWGNDATSRKLTFTFAATLLAATPGVDTALVLRLRVTAGARPAVFGALGVALLRLVRFAGGRMF